MPLATVVPRLGPHTEAAQGNGAADILAPLAR